MSLAKVLDRIAASLKRAPGKPLELSDHQFSVICNMVLTLTHMQAQLKGAFNVDTYATDLLDALLRVARGQPSAGLWTMPDEIRLTPPPLAEATFKFDPTPVVGRSQVK